MSFFIDVTLLGHEVAYSDIDFVLQWRFGTLRVPIPEHARRL